MPVGPRLSLREHALAMAHYNQWMNDKLYDVVATLDDAQRKQDRGAFFQSIHGTLNHLLVADQAWIQRLHGQTVTMTSPRQEVHADFEPLRATRREVDQALIAWAEALTEADEAREFSFFSVAYQKQFTMPLWTIVLHLFNHQTHHRGQLTTLLTQMGLDVGVTDLPWLPYLNR